jgi:hypothetical protein
LCPPRKANGSTAHFFLPQSAKPVGAIGPPGVGLCRLRRGGPAFVPPIVKANGSTAHFFLPQSAIGPSRKAAYA